MASYLTSALADLERAFNFIESDDSMGPREAVIVADRAVNELLKAKLAELRTSIDTTGKQRSKNFPNIVRSVETWGGILIPMKDELFTVHKTRNSCVHSGEVVEGKQARSLVKITHQFALTFSRYLELDQAQVRLLEVVSKPRIKKPANDLSSPHTFLTTALAALDSGDTHHAIRDAMGSIETLLTDFAYEETELESLENLLDLREVQALFSRRLISELKGIYPFAREVVVHYLYTETQTAERVVRMAKLAIRQASGRWLSTRHCLICGSARVVGYRLPGYTDRRTYRSHIVNVKAYFCMRHRTFCD